jgi:predicted component of type VI protein secretion system
VAVRPTTIDSIAVKPIERTDLDKEVSFMMVEISRRILVLDQVTKRDVDQMNLFLSIDYRGAGKSGNRPVGILSLILPNAG